MELAKCFQEANQKIESLLRQEVNKRIGGDVQQVQTFDVQKDALKFRHLLLLLWILSYRFQDKSFRVVVNAVTCEVQGERPWSVVKLALAGVAGLVVFFVLYKMGLLDR